MTGLAWALWLAVPVAATTLAALWVWWRGWRARRAARPLRTESAVRAHSEYLAALTVAPRSRERGIPRPPSASTSEVTSEVTSAPVETPVAASPATPLTGPVHGLGARPVARDAAGR